MIANQCAVLTDLGWRVRLIVGEGEKPPNVELCVVPEMYPSASQGAGASGPDTRDRWPEKDHPAVEVLYRKLCDVLQGCAQCWVHNAFTVYLNPFLTVALQRLVGDLASIRWVVWCEDISALSTFREGFSGEPELGAGPGDRITYVTISQARQRELAQLLSIGAEEIRVIPPPLDVAAWLDLGNEARQILERLSLLQTEPVVLVPAKLLPHKNLELAVHLASCLVERAPRPLVLLSGAASPHDRDVSRTVKQQIERLARQRGVSSCLHLLPDVLGTIPVRRTIRDLMLLCDVVFLPSAEEGFGVPIQEAAALRAPLLCSDISPFREAAGEYAGYFSLQAAPPEIADQVMAIARSSANVIRRKTLSSSTRFRSQLEALLSITVPEGGLP